MALIKGICKNFGECDHADNKEVQEVDKMNFVCEECGKPLFPVEGKTSKSGNKGGTNVKLIGIVIAAILLLGGIGFGVYTLIDKLGGDKKPMAIKLENSKQQMKVGETMVLTPKVEPEGAKATFNFKPSKSSKDLVKVTADGELTALKKGEAVIHIKCEENPDISKICKIMIIEDTVKIDSTAQKKDPAVNQPVDKKEQKVESRKTEQKPQQVTTPLKTQDGYGTKNLGYGVYEGKIENGKPSGMGGQIRFTRSHTIDLKKASGETVEVYPGDVMVNVKMKDGRLIQGQLKRTDGSQRWIIIG